MYYIYQIQNKLNDKKYIGFTTQLPTDRWIDHKYYALNSLRKSLLYSAIKKYGTESFLLSVLCQGEDHQAGLTLAEPLLIEVFKPEYNMTRGGDGLLDPSPEVRDKLRRSAIRRGLGQNQTGNNNHMFGKRWHHTKESKDKIRTAATGRIHSEATKQKMRVAKLGNQNRLGKRI
jgi:group I intron endonuclease